MIDKWPDMSHHGIAYLRLLNFLLLLHSLFSQTIVGIYAVNAEEASDENEGTLAEYGSGGEGYSRQERRYLSYEVNPGEGFNLRRDVYMRVANTVRQLRGQGHGYVLVLPPWSNLYHWRKNHSYRTGWSEFFDLESMSRFIPVMEFDAFQQVHGAHIDLVLYLQSYVEGWTSGRYEEKFHLRECIEADRHYRELGNGQWQRFSGDFIAHELKCLSIQGQSSTLASAIIGNFSKLLSLLVDRAETILHDRFGDWHYWEARRSMRYAKELRHIGDAFRGEKFKSTDELDHTTLNENWTLDRSGQKRLAKGDFINAHGRHIPSITGTAAQISRLLKRLDLHQVFLSTDAPEEEIDELRAKLANLEEKQVTVERFSNESLSDGANAIVDQWICAHAAFFIGTHLSTFSFRIQEDREILGFPPSTTFNRLCPDDEDGSEPKCEQPTRWTISYSREEDERRL